jgi:tetratricopeptide (TPR) repeat protein
VGGEFLVPHTGYRGGDGYSHFLTRREELSWRRLDCLDEDTVLAFVDGRLPAAARTQAEAHLAICPSCTDLVAAAAGADPLVMGTRPLEETLKQAGELARGETVGRYVILNLVGRGGMGEVYAAYDPQLDRRIALKLLHDTDPAGAAPRIGRARLLREAKAIARLSHPNVVVVHDAGAIADAVQGERVFLAMEFIDGQTLSEWLAAEPRSWRAVRELFVAAGEGLAAAHEAGLVHRDFKPQNVMVGRDGSVRVMDFGLASDTSDGAEDDDALLDLGDIARAPTRDTVALTRTGALLGTPLYMAPEQFRAQATDARSDQFSFCVALYEALYGERPFPSGSLGQLVEAVLAGRVGDPPAKARVPAFLRRLLLRGLAVDPAARYPSMRELLGALRSDPGRRRSTAMVGALLATAAVAGVVGVQRLATRGQRICGGAADKLAGIWELSDEGTRRSAVHRAFVATGRGFAEQTWSRVAALLDDYDRRWTAVYTDSCEATHVRGDQSAEVLDLRTACLEGPRSALRALTDLFTRADGAVLVEAVNAAQALPALDRCSDVAGLRAVVAPPDAAARSRVAALSVRLAEVKALRDTGQWRQALDRARRLSEQARAIGYEPLLAEVLSTQAWLDTESGDAAAGSKTFNEVVWLALAAHRDDIAAEAAGELVGLEGYYLARIDEGRRWVEPAEALLRRVGPGHDRIAGWLHQNRAVLEQRAGDHVTADREFQVALEYKIKALPAGHPDIGRSYYSIASNDIDAGDGRAALAAADRAVAIYRAAFGSESPLMWVVLDGRGEALALLGRNEEAERDLRVAVERAEGLYGAGHAWTAIPLNALGAVLADRGNLREAIPILERTLAVRERREPGEETVAETRFALGRALWQADKDRPRALALVRASRDDYRRLAGHERQLAAIDAWLQQHQGTAG